MVFCRVFQPRAEPWNYENFYVCLTFPISSWTSLAFRAALSGWWINGRVLFAILIRGHLLNFLVIKGQRCLFNEKKSYLAAWRHGISLPVFNLLSHEWARRTRNLKRDSITMHTHVLFSIQFESGHDIVARRLKKKFNISWSWHIRTVTRYRRI